MDKYEYLAGRNILTLQQHKIEENTKFTYSTWWKTFENKQKQLESKYKKKRTLQAWDLTSSKTN